MQGLGFLTTNKMHAKFVALLADKLDKKALLKLIEKSVADYIESDDIDELGAMAQIITMKIAINKAGMSDLLKTIDNIESKR